MNIREVIVIVEGGVVQDVDVPEGVTVRIRDYDVDHLDDSDPSIHIDEYGDYYVEGVWRI